MSEESAAVPDQTSPWADSEAYYVRVQDAPADLEDRDGVSRTTLHPSIHTQGAWRTDEQHMAATSGLVAGELARHQARPELRVARLSFEILGTLHDGPFTVETRTVRPGRTIELVEAVMTSRGRPCLVGRAWRLATSDTSSAAVVQDPALPEPEQGVVHTEMSQWPGGYIQSISATVLPGHAPGHGRVWLSTDHPMVEGEPTSDLVRLMGLVDTANGIAPAAPMGPGGYAFPNVDLQIHLFRTPVGSRLGLANSVSIGEDGVGLTSAVLHDEQGPFGRSEQILTVREMPAGA